MIAARFSRYVFIVLTTLIGSSCTSTPDLGARIVQGRPQQCHNADCVNPHVLAVESGYVVTTSVDGQFKHQQILAEALPQFLLALPMSAWPRGPEILITPTDVVQDGRLVEVRVHDAERICRRLGLTVAIRPGG